MFKVGFFTLIYTFLNCSDKALPLPTHNVEVVQCGWVTMEDRWPYEGEGIFARTIKEWIYIRVNNPTFKRNIYKYNLPHI